MEPLDHDMDDLLRKAAADYPLNPGESDWDKVSAQLDQTPIIPEVRKRKNTRYYLLLILALFLFLVLGGLFYYGGKRNELPKTSYTGSAGDSIKMKALNKIVNKNELTARSNQKIIPGNSAGIREDKVSIRRSIQSRGEKFPSENKSSSPIKSVPGAEKVTKITVDNISIINDNKFELINKESTEGANVLRSSQVKALPVLLQFAIPEPVFHFPPVRISSSHFQNQKGLYIGLNGGAELSKVGSQTVAKTGYHGGVLLGYRFNTKLSVESGMLLGKKRYYSAGKYFSMSKIASAMPVGMEIITVDGQSSQLEIPVVLKYDFLHRRQSGLFFTAGVVSYIYLQEKNYYETRLNGVQDNQMGMYKEDQFSPASDLQISGGYEHALGKLVRFRIEPYKKIPLKKSGMGSMKVFSSGVNISFIHSF